MRNKTSFLNGIKEVLGPNEVHFFWKGRVALYALLKGCGVSNGDEVIIPAFTCVVVPNAIKYLGAKPVYVDIDKGSLGASLGAIRNSITSKTKVIICQNTFGLSFQLTEIVELARSKNVTTIEDCTHGFGGFYQSRPNGAFCDASFFSTQWNKPFSTGVGGFSVLNTPNKFPFFKEVYESCKRPGLKDNLALLILHFARKWLLKDWNYFMLINLYRWLSRYNLILGSSKGKELTSVIMPNHYLLKMGWAQYALGNRAINKLQSINIERKEAAHLYSKFLMENGKTSVPDQFFTNHLFLKYPILVNDRQGFMIKAEKEKVLLGDWFISPIHPVKNEFEKWDLDISQFPTAAYITNHVVNLPTDSQDPKRVIAFLSKNLDDLI